MEWYIGKEYSFVVSFADFSAPAPSDRPAALSLFVAFPTEKIFYPLKPSSVYGRSPMPVHLLIVGHVDPDLYHGIRFHTWVKFLSGRLELGRGAEPFWLGREAAPPRYFTQIDMGALSEDLTDDLWIKNSSPRWIRKWRLLDDLLVAWFIALYLGCSALASLAAANLSFKDPRMPASRTLAHGLINGLTMLAFVPAAFWLGKKKKRMTYLLLFYVFFLAMLGVGAGIPWLIAQ